MFLNVFKCRSDFKICFQPVPVSDYCGPYATPESLHQLAGNLISMIIFDKEQERTKFNDNIFLLLLNTMCSCYGPISVQQNTTTFMNVCSIEIFKKEKKKHFSVEK